MLGAWSTFGSHPPPQDGEFLDTIFDTDGRPNRDAVDLVESEGEDLEDEP